MFDPSLPQLMSDASAIIAPEFRFPTEKLASIPTSTHAQSGSNDKIKNLGKPDSPCTRRHTRQRESLALPAFSFNPTAKSKAEPHAEFTTPPPSPLPSSAQCSPARSAHHRRAHSEFIGDDDGPTPTILRQPSPSKDSDRIVYDRPITPPETSTRKGHRHRRSGALSSQDLSAITRQTTAPAHENRKVDHRSSPHSPQTDLVAPAPLSSSLCNIATRLPSPTRVSFADNVEVIPRRSLPTLKSQPHVHSLRPSHSSDGAEDRLPTFPKGSSTREYHSIEDGHVGPGQIIAACTCDSLSHATILESRILSSQDTPAEKLLTFSCDDRLLSNDFDRDPTLTMISDRQQSTAPPNASTDARQLLDTEESIVNLDDANETYDTSGAPVSSQDLRTLRAKSFSAARHSMHSSGLLATSATSHRRTESAPSLPVAPFERPILKRLDSVTASEKGFEMENVFEEEEEDSSLRGDSLGEYPCVPTSFTSETATSCRTSCNDSSTRPTLTPTHEFAQPDGATQPPVKPVFAHPLQFEVKKSLKRANAAYLTLAESPSPGTKDFGTLHTSPQTASLTPDTSDVSLLENQQEPVPRFLGCTSHDACPSNDGVPSLISSRSTRTSSAHYYTDSAASPNLSASPGAARRHSKTANTQSRGRKRNSIVSLLMNGSSGSNSDITVDDPAHGRGADRQTTAQPFSKRKHWYQRHLRFWKPQNTKYISRDDT